MTTRLHDMCIECYVPLRRWNEKAADFPEGRNHGAHGRCDTCDKRIRRGSTIPEPAADVYVPQQPIDLVRWTHTRDGYQPEIVTGRYVKRDRRTWTITVAGVPRRFDRTEWLRCVA